MVDNALVVGIEITARGDKDSDIRENNILN